MWSTEDVISEATVAACLLDSAFDDALLCLVVNLLLSTSSSVPSASLRLSASSSIRRVYPSPPLFTSQWLIYGYRSWTLSIICHSHTLDCSAEGGAYSSWNLPSMLVCQCKLLSSYLLLSPWSNEMLAWLLLALFLNILTSDLSISALSIFSLVLLIWILIIMII